MWNMSADTPSKIHGFVCVLFVHFSFNAIDMYATTHISELLCVLSAEIAGSLGHRLNRHFRLLFAVSLCIM